MLKWIFKCPFKMMKNFFNLLGFFEKKNPNSPALNILVIPCTLKKFYLRDSVEK